MQPINRINFDSTSYNFTAKLVTRASEARYIRLISLIGSSIYSWTNFISNSLYCTSSFSDRKQSRLQRVIYYIICSSYIYVDYIFEQKIWNIKFLTSIYSYNFLQNKFCILDTVYTFFFLINSIFFAFLSLYLKSNLSHINFFKAYTFLYICIFI